MNFNDLLTLVGALLLWFFVTRVVFPKLGIPSCCGTSCQTDKNSDSMKGDKNV